MALGDYLKTTFVEGSAPGISAARLNNHENKTAELDIEAKSKNAQLLEATGYGVISGLTVTAQTTPDMTVNVVTGTVHMSTGQRYTPDATPALAVTAADATNPRIDIVYVSSAGVISYLAGTPAASPAAPATPTDGFLLAQISVAANATTVVAANITDKRKLKNTTDSLADAQAAHLAENATQAHGGLILGTLNTDLNKIKALSLKTDTRTTTLTYTSGALTSVVDADGATTVKTTTLNYTSGVLTSVSEVAGGTTVTTTLNYTSGVLTSVTKAVS